MQDPRYYDGLHSVADNGTSTGGVVYAENMPSGNLQFNPPEYYSPPFEDKTANVSAVPVAESSPSQSTSRLCGLRPRTVWLILIICVLLVIGGVAGGVVAGLHHKSSNQSGSEQPTSVSSSTTTSSPTNSPTSESTTSSQTSSATPSPTSDSLFDANTWYRLTNSYSGSDIALDVVNDNGVSSSGTLQMTTTNTVSGQYWQVRQSSDGKTYALCTQFLGPNMRLDVSGTTPQLAPISSSASGQMWTITGWGDGTWRFASGATGSDLFMDTYSNTLQLVMDEGSHSGQRWKLDALGSINNSSFST